MNNESTDQRDKFIEDLSGRIDDRKSIYKRINRIQWITMLLVVTAGFFTSAAGVAHNQNFIISNPIALIVFGLIAAVGTAVNQYINTQNRSPSIPSHHENCSSWNSISCSVRKDVCFSGVPASYSSISSPRRSHRCNL